MDKPEIEQLQAEVQRLRAEVQLLIKGTQLRDANAAAHTSILQALANLTMLSPDTWEPLAAALRMMYEIRRDQPGVTALYREQFEAAFKATLPDHLKRLVLPD
ncbi:hypothetical protein [Burkholderia multivorans]|uniref:Uncharacterized protein n=1 Tax=Burkholderia multivorans TaxID=87883 RepID=A0AAP2HI59_9BURK|nr:hypothetical protein [Burkholderia multivorans]AJY18617.1 hypothetical protein NP80_2191 [Burkholderia multivorans ATCC BAA-247]AVR22530.1 hypothetical protein A8H40_24755 [Burkholderia multivorans]MBR7893195.1 hypothetical protein [Burkholderia multivorans]MBU9145372.1 hypothetical protein [Burkholderia multivorans]MBU9356608.1 hypothetical protein [Burkholderia multivorans]